MAEISMRRPHGLDDPDEVRARIERLAKQVTSRVGGHWAWSGDGILCEARGARARVGYDATEIAIEVWLCIANWGAPVMLEWRPRRPVEATVGALLVIGLLVPHLLNPAKYR